MVAITSNDWKTPLLAQPLGCVLWFTGASVTGQ
jgi:hypothetical protein